MNIENTNNKEDNIYKQTVNLETYIMLD